MADIIITHTHENGTTIEGSTRGDGVYEILKRHGFTWRPAPGIHIRGSRDKNAQTWKINAGAEALREAGHTVTVTIDNTPRPTAVVEAERAERAEARADRLAERADKHTTAGDARLAAARNITDGIPFGQPIQPPGHHSHNKHVNALNRADGHRGKAVEHLGAGRGRPCLRGRTHHLRRTGAGGPRRNHRRRERPGAGRRVGAVRGAGHNLTRMRINR